ncbi:MAG: asparagine--tRNA ligase, partial [bacterium]
MTDEVVRVTIDTLRDFAGRRVELRGWLYNRRSSGKVQFLLVRDGTGIVQAVVARTEVSEDTFAAADRLSQESSVIVTGVVREDARAAGGVELSVTGLVVVQQAEPYPITPKEHGVEFLMDHRHLWLRSTRQHAVLRVRAEVIRAMTDYLDGSGFLRVDAPILTPAAVEGTTTLFATPYFDLGSAYLTQSGQLYNEATAMAFGRVYCFGPTFRAEKSKTRRHLTEFWMLEPEAAYMELDDYMALAEGFVAGVVARVLERCRSELKTLERDVAPLERAVVPFPRISYDDALRLLAEKGKPMTWGDDLGGDEETA